MLFLLLALQVQSQYPLAVWNQEGTTLTEVQSYTYKYSIDGGNEISFSGVTCKGPGKVEGINIDLFTCEALLPYTILGEHTIYLVTQNKDGSAKGEPTRFVLESRGIGTPNPVIITIK